MEKMAHKKILVVDDDPQIRMLLRDRLEANNYQVIEAENGRLGLESVQRDNPDLVLLDLQMPEMDGMQLLTQLHQKFPELIVVILTAFGSIERAVEALKLGAHDFLPKPCKPDHILLVVKKALERKDLRDENRYLRQEIENQYRMIVGQSNEMAKVMEIAESVATSKTTVLIGGESGTGKQLMARCIHQMSKRKDKPFIQVNCTTLSEQLMESDLFGHEKGAFTGAVKQKKGRFELANKGTLFLDEIGDLSPVIQAKLLHVLEYSEFQRVGGVATLTADVRILAATNKDLLQAIQENRFREDLYYRLNVMKLQLPALRTRADDIPIFADFFLLKHNRAMQKNITGISPETMKRLQNYPWPGNIRELENVIERAIVLAPGSEITPDLLPQFTTPQDAAETAVGTALDEALAIFKKRFIAKTLQFTENNQTQAAKLLKIQRTYLNRLIKELEIDS